MPKAPYTWRQPPYPADDSDVRWIDPSMLVLCQDGDIEQAIGPLLGTLNEPLARGIVGAVFVHETMREKLIERVRERMTVMHRLVKSHASHIKALSRIECLGAEQVSMMKPDDIGFQYSMVEGSPIIVCDFSQSYFSSNHPSSVVTLHTFRHSQELAELVAKEKVPFVSASVWCPKMATAYEIALMLFVPAVYINCARIDLAPIIMQSKELEPCALLRSDYHYEVIVQNNRSKCVVFPAPVQQISKPKR